jgi:hypothetical protein
MKDLFAKYDNQHHKENLISIIRQINNMYDKMVSYFSEITSRYAYKLPQIQANNVWAFNGDIEKHIDKYLDGFSKDLKIRIRNYIANAWDLAENKNDEIIKEILKISAISGATIVAGKVVYNLFNRQASDIITKGAHVTIKDVLTAPRNSDAISSFFLDRKAKGFNLSERVWDLQKSNKAMIEELLGNGILEGNSASEIGLILRQYLHNPDTFFRRVRDKETGELKLSASAKVFNPGQGVYRSPRLNAIRLAANETNLAYRYADHQRWQNNPLVVGYEVSVTGTHVEDMCDDLEGEYPKDFIFSGWHVLCRCAATPIMATQDEMKEHIQSILQGTEQETVQSVNTVKEVPEGFKNWVEKNSDRVSGWNSQPYWVQDNFKNGDITKGLHINQ